MKEGESFLRYLSEFVSYSVDTQSSKAFLAIFLWFSRTCNADFSRVFGFRPLKKNLKGSNDHKIENCHHVKLSAKP